MLTFTHNPPEADRSYSIDLIRTPSGKNFAAVITSEDLHGCNTHFWGGRTVPCVGEDCKACAEGQPYRWHAYFSCFCHADWKPYLFETTAKSLGNLLAYREQYKTLRGCLFSANRAKYSKNSKVIIICKPADMTKLVLPNEPDIFGILAQVWNIPRSAFSETAAREYSPLIGIDMIKTRQVTDFKALQLSGNGEKH